MTTTAHKLSSDVSRRRLLVLLTVVAVSVVAAWWGARVGAHWADPAAAADGQGVLRAADQAVSLRGDAAWDARPLRVAADAPLSELQHLPPEQQIAAVDALPPGRALTQRQVAGLKDVVASAQALDVVRNNAANRLIQRQDDSQLWRFFADLHEREDASAVWHDYSLQFWALSIPFAADVDAAAGALAAIAESAEETVAGTALLHLARLRDDGLDIDQAVIHGVIRGRLEAVDTPDALRHTCLALIGEGGHRDLLPLVRSALANDRGIEALRGALYSLGRLGTADDQTLIAPYLNHDHPGVVAAARAAAERLAAASPAESDGGDRS